MRHFLIVLAVALAGTASSLAQTAQETLPRPYTAEQLRDAWKVGAELVMHTTDSKGESRERTTSTAWSPEGVTMRSEPVDAQGASTGPAEEYKATWTELLGHASFPAATAHRERAKRETPLGALDGWLYVVPQADGATSEFFFADALPGPPVLYGSRRGETWLTRSERISWKPAPP